MVGPWAENSVAAHDVAAQRSGCGTDVHFSSPSARAWLIALSMAAASSGSFSTRIAKPLLPGRRSWSSSDRYQIRRLTSS